MIRDLEKLVKGIIVIGPHHDQMIGLIRHKLLYTKGSEKR